MFDLLNGYLILSKKIYGNSKYNGSWNFGPTKKHVTVKNVMLKLIKILNIKKKSILNLMKKLKRQDC